MQSIGSVDAVGINDIVGRENESVSDFVARIQSNPEIAQPQKTELDDTDRFYIDASGIVDTQVEGQDYRRGVIEDARRTADEIRQREALEDDEDSYLDSLGDAWDRGVAGWKGSTWTMGAYLADIFGANETAANWHANARYNSIIGEAKAKKTGIFSDGSKGGMFDSLDNFAHGMLEIGGEMAPNLIELGVDAAVIAGTSGFGLAPVLAKSASKSVAKKGIMSGIKRGAAKVLGKKAAESSMKKAALKSMGEAAYSNYLRSGKLAGDVMNKMVTKAGVAMASYKTHAGGMYQSSIENGDPSALSSLAAAVISTAAETGIGLEANIINRLSGKALTAEGAKIAQKKGLPFAIDYVSKNLTGLVKSSLGEGVEEMIQTATEKTQESMFVKGQTFTYDDFIEILEAGVMGALGGGMFEGIGSAAGSIGSGDSKTLSKADVQFNELNSKRLKSDSSFEYESIKREIDENGETPELKARLSEIEESSGSNDIGLDALSETERVWYNFLKENKDDKNALADEDGEFSKSLNEASIKEESQDYAQLMNISLEDAEAKIRQSYELDEDLNTTKAADEADIEIKTNRVKPIIESSMKDLSTLLTKNLNLSESEIEYISNLDVDQISSIVVAMSENSSPSQSAEIVSNIEAAIPRTSKENHGTRLARAVSKSMRFIEDSKRTSRLAESLTKFSRIMMDKGTNNIRKDIAAYQENAYTIESSAQLFDIMDREKFSAEVQGDPTLQDSVLEIQKRENVTEEDAINILFDEVKKAEADALADINKNKVEPKVETESPTVVDQDVEVDETAPKELKPTTTIEPKVESVTIDDTKDATSSKSRNSEVLRFAKEFRAAVKKAYTRIKGHNKNLNSNQILKAALDKKDPIALRAVQAARYDAAVSSTNHSDLNSMRALKYMNRVVSTIVDAVKSIVDPGSESEVYSMLASFFQDNIQAFDGATSDADFWKVVEGIDASNKDPNVPGVQYVAAVEALLAVEKDMKKAGVNLDTKSITASFRYVNVAGLFKAKLDSDGKIEGVYSAKRINAGAPRIIGEFKSEDLKKLETIDQFYESINYDPTANIADQYASLFGYSSKYVGFINSILVDNEYIAGSKAEIEANMASDIEVAKDIFERYFKDRNDGGAVSVVTILSKNPAAQSIEGNTPGKPVKISFDIQRYHIDVMGPRLNETVMYTNTDGKQDTNVMAGSPLTISLMKLSDPRDKTNQFSIFDGIGNVKWIDMSVSEQQDIIDRMFFAGYVKAPTFGENKKALFFKKPETDLFAGKNATESQEILFNHVLGDVSGSEDGTFNIDDMFGGSISNLAKRTSGIDTGGIPSPKSVKVEFPSSELFDTFDGKFKKLFDNDYAKFLKHFDGKTFTHSKFVETLKGDIGYRNLGLESNSDSPGVIKAHINGGGVVIKSLITNVSKADKDSDSLLFAELQEVFDKGGVDIIAFPDFNVVEVPVRSKDGSIDSVDKVIEDVKGGASSIKASTAKAKFDGATTIPVGGFVVVQDLESESIPEKTKALRQIVSTLSALPESETRTKAIGDMMREALGDSTDETIKELLSDPLNLFSSESGIDTRFVESMLAFGKDMINNPIIKSQLFPLISGAIASKMNAKLLKGHGTSRASLDFVDPITGLNRLLKDTELVDGKIIPGEGIVSEIMAAEMNLRVPMVIEEGGNLTKSVIDALNDAGYKNNQDIFENGKLILDDFVKLDDGRWIIPGSKISVTRVPADSAGSTSVVRVAATSKTNGVMLSKAANERSGGDFDGDGLHVTSFDGTLSDDSPQNRYVKSIFDDYANPDYYNQTSGLAGLDELTKEFESKIEPVIDKSITEPGKMDLGSLEYEKYITDVVNRGMSMLGATVNALSSATILINSPGFKLSWSPAQYGHHKLKSGNAEFTLRTKTDYSAEELTKMSQGLRVMLSLVMDDQKNPKMAGLGLNHNNITEVIALYMVGDFSGDVHAGDVLANAINYIRDYQAKNEGKNPNDSSKFSIIGLAESLRASKRLYDYGMVDKFPDSILESVKMSKDPLSHLVEAGHGLGDDIPLLPKGLRHQVGRAGFVFPREVIDGKYQNNELAKNYYKVHETQGYVFGTYDELIKSIPEELFGNKFNHDRALDAINTSHAIEVLTKLEDGYKIPVGNYFIENFMRAMGDGTYKFDRKKNMTRALLNDKVKSDAAFMALDENVKAYIVNSVLESKPTLNLNDNYHLSAIPAAYLLELYNSVNEKVSSGKEVFKNSSDIKAIYYGKRSENTRSFHKAENGTNIEISDIDIKLAEDKTGYKVIRNAKENSIDHDAKVINLKEDATLDVLHHEVTHYIMRFVSEKDSHLYSALKKEIDRLPETHPVKKAVANNGYNYRYGSDEFYDEAIAHYIGYRSAKGLKAKKLISKIMDLIKEFFGIQVKLDAQSSMNIIAENLYSMNTNSKYEGDLDKPIGKADKELARHRNVIASVEKSARNLARDLGVKPKTVMLAYMMTQSVQNPEKAVFINPEYQDAAKLLKDGIKDTHHFQYIMDAMSKEILSMMKTFNTKANDFGFSKIIDPRTGKAYSIVEADKLGLPPKDGGNLSSLTTLYNTLVSGSTVTAILGKLHKESRVSLNKTSDHDTSVEIQDPKNQNENITYWMNKDDAKFLNNYHSKTFSQLLDGKAKTVYDKAEKVNMIMKSWQLALSTFHAMSLVKSLVFGSHIKKWWSIPHVVKNIRDGLNSYEEFNDDVQLLFEAGFTGDLVTAFDFEANSAVGAFSLPIVKSLNKFTFDIVGRGAKTQAALLELKHLRETRPDLSDYDRALLASEVVNNDFGGLNHKRLRNLGIWGIRKSQLKGRDRAVQSLLPFFALGADWTESNMRTMGALFSQDADIRQVHWVSAMRIATRVAMINIALGMINAFMGEDEVEDVPMHFYNQLADAYDSGALRWMDADVSELFKAMSIANPDKKYYFRSAGHFIDFFKAVPDFEKIFNSNESFVKDIAQKPFEFAVHKGSNMSRIFFAMLTGMDTSMRRYKTMEEFMNDMKGKGKLNIVSAEKYKWFHHLKNPSAMANVFMGEAYKTLPFTVQSFMNVANGTKEPAIGMAEAMGLTIKDPLRANKKFYEKTHFSESAMKDALLSSLQDMFRNNDGGVSVPSNPASYNGSRHLGHAFDHKNNLPAYSVELIEPKPTKDYGLRNDGTKKGSGFLGELPMRGKEKGKVATEMSIGVSFDGKEMEIPLLVPTLTKKHINHLLRGREATPEIEKRATEHARKRLSKGKSPFAGPKDVVGKKDRDGYDFEDTFQKNLDNIHRGHMAQFSTTQTANDAVESFKAKNILAMKAIVNTGVWSKIEKEFSQYENAHIITGAINDDWALPSIEDAEGKRVKVPRRLYKLIAYKDGGTTKYKGYIVDNNRLGKAEAVSLKKIANLTGYRFFKDLGLN